MVENNTGNGPFDGDGFCIAPAPMFLLYVPFPAHFVLLPLSSPLIPPAETDRCILRDMWTLAYERSYVQVSRNKLSFACHTRIILFSSNREIRRMMSKSTQFYVLKKKLLLQIQFPTYQNFFRTFLIKRKFAGNVYYAITDSFVKELSIAFYANFSLIFPWETRGTCARQIVARPYILALRWGCKSRRKPRCPCGHQ